MIRTKTFLLIAVCSLFVMSCSEDGTSPLSGSTQPLTNEEVIAGLKQALEVGTDTTVVQLNKLNGYLNNPQIKIPFPPEVQRVADKVREVSSIVPGGEKLVDDFVVQMNRAAEDAASEASPIFVDAIRGMSISDGMQILKGADTAATNYLRINTFSNLRAAFTPKIKTSMEKVRAQQTWNTLATAYNNLNPLIRQGDLVTTDLSGYVTGRALSGLFVVLGQEEQKIRKDPIRRVTDLLRRVFGSLG
jgi:hypothetical protein